MEPITLALDVQLTPRSKNLLATLNALTAEIAPQSTVAASKIPAIGQPWPGQVGIYAGISRGEDGQPDAYLVLLTDTPQQDALDWPAAMAWAQALGDGARLPTRFEFALLYAHLRDQFDTSPWYWTSTQSSADCAWCQDFHYGTQSITVKGSEARARAVRRFPL